MLRAIRLHPEASAVEASSIADEAACPKRAAAAEISLGLAQGKSTVTQCLKCVSDADPGWIASTPDDERQWRMAMGPGWRLHLLHRPSSTLLCLRLQSNSALPKISYPAGASCIGLVQSVQVVGINLNLSIFRYSLPSGILLPPQPSRVSQPTLGLIDRSSAKPPRRYLALFVSPWML